MQYKLPKESENHFQVDQVPQEENVAVTLCWVSGHGSFRANELADCATKEAAREAEQLGENASDVGFSTCISKAKCLLKQKCLSVQITMVYIFCL